MKMSNMISKVVRLFAFAFCAVVTMTVSAADYTLTDQSVEWPSSDNASNNSLGNRFTIVGDVTIAVANTPNVAVPAHRASLVVSDGATLMLDLSALSGVPFRVIGGILSHGTGKVRVKGDPSNIVFGTTAFSVLVDKSVFDAPDFAFVDANDDETSDVLTFAGTSAVRRWPSCGYAFASASVGLLGDGGVMLEPEGGTLTLATSGIKDLMLYNDNALGESVQVEVPTGCTLYMKPASFSTNTFTWAGEANRTNSTDVVLAGGKLSLQAAPDHYVTGDITGAGIVSMDVVRGRGSADEFTWLMGNVAFDGSVNVANGNSETSPDRLNFCQSSSPGHETNKVSLAKWSQLAFFAPDGGFAPEVTIGHLQGAEATSVLRVPEGQTVTVNTLTGTFKKMGAGTVVFGSGAGDVSSWSESDGIVYANFGGDSSTSEVSLASIVNTETATNVISIGGSTSLFTGASTSYVVRAAAGSRARVLVDDNVPVVLGSDGTLVLESRDWRSRAALWIDPSTTEAGPFGTCAKDEWWGSYISEATSNNYVNGARASGAGYYIEYMPDCRNDRTGWFLRNTRNYDSQTSSECLPQVYAYQNPNGCNGLATICCAGASRRLPIASGEVKGTTNTSIPADMVIMVFGSQDGGGKALVGTTQGTFGRSGNTTDDGLTTKGDASIWLDGEKVSDPTTQKFNGGWQIVSIDTSGYNVNGFGWASNYGNAGGQNYGEILVFTNKLSDVERSCVESYLADKWGISTYRRGGASSSVRAVGRTGNIEIAAGAEMALGGCYAGTIDVKSGAVLTVSDDLLPPTADELPDTGRVCWFDPDAEGCLYLPNENKEFVRAVLQRGTTISSISDSDIFLWTPSDRSPSRAIGARGWGPVRTWIDFQEIVSPYAAGVGNCLRTRRYPDTNPTIGSGGSNMSIPCRTVFVVSDSFRGGGSPVLAGMSSSEIVWRTTDNYKSPIWPAGTVSRVINGETRLNGASVDSSAGFTGAPEVFSFSTTSDQNIGVFGNYNNTQASLNNGEVLGEIMLYNTELTGSDRLAVEAYLMGKWCGTLPAGYSDLREATVTGTGTVVAPLSKMPHIDASFAGTVRVTGDVAVFDVVIDPVNGTVTGGLLMPNVSFELPDVATINVTFTSRPKGGGEWTLVDIGSLLSVNTEWAVNASVEGLSVVKSVSPTRVAVTVRPSGFVLVVR